MIIAFILSLTFFIGLIYSPIEEATQRQKDIHGVAVLITASLTATMGLSVLLTIME